MHPPQTGTDIFSAIVAAPFGAVGIRTDAGSVRELVYLPPHFAEKDPLDAAAELAASQVAQYFADPDFVFSLPLLQAGKVKPLMDSSFPLEDAAGAHRRMETSEHIGKIVLVV